MELDRVWYVSAYTYNTSRLRYVFHGVGESGDAETPIVHVKSLSITPDLPVAGQNLTVLAEADVNQQITVSTSLPSFQLRFCVRIILLSSYQFEVDVCEHVM